MPYHVLFKGVHFVLSYSTQRWNAYVAVDLLKIKTEKRKMPLTKAKHVQLFSKDIQKVTFHELK